MKKVFLSLSIILINGIGIFAQQKADSLKVIKLDEVVVSATRVGQDAPVAYSSLTEKQLKGEDRKSVV